MNFESFITITIVHFLGIISPGPDIIAITRYAINNGMRGVARFATGIVIGQFIYLFSSIFGLTKIIFKFYYFKLLFYFFSGIYLLYLGFTMIKKNNISQNEYSDHEIKKNQDPLKMATLITISNPNAAIFYSSILANFINENSSNFSLVLLIIYLTLATFIFFYLSAFIFSRMKESLNKYRIALDKIFGSILIYFSLKLFYSILTLTKV